MHAVHWLGKALVAGGVALLAGACGHDKFKCTCDLKNDISNTETVETALDCATFAEENTAKYSSCSEASGSIVGPSWPIALRIRNPYEFPTTLLPVQATGP